MLAVLITWFWFAGGKVISAGDIQGIICSPTPDKTPSAMCLETISDWQGMLSVDTLRNGRKGTALIAIAWFCMHTFTTLVVCSWTAEDVKTDVARQAEHEKVTSMHPPFHTRLHFIFSLMLPRTHPPKKLLERAKRLKNKAKPEKAQKKKAEDDEEEEMPDPGQTYKLSKHKNKHVTNSPQRTLTVNRQIMAPCDLAPCYNHDQLVGGCGYMHYSHRIVVFTSFRWLYQLFHCHFQIFVFILRRNND